VNLRTRITLIACLGCSLLAVGLVLEGLIRERSVEQRLQQSRQNSFRYAWNGIVNTEIQRLTLEISAINRNTAALNAVVRGDQEAFIEAVRPLLLRFQTGLTGTSVEVARLDGELFFSNAVEPQQRLLAPAVIEAVLRRGGALSGLFRRDAGDYVVATAFPLFSRVQPTGVAAFQIPVEQLLRRLASSTGAAFFLVEGIGGSLTAGTDGELWRFLSGNRQGLVGPFPRRVWQAPRASLDNPYPGLLDTRVLSLLALPLDGAMDSPGLLLAVEDVSAAFWRDGLASALGFGIAGLSVSLFLALLYWYLRRAFGPLNAVIQVLNNLAAGDTRASVALPPGPDEIGRLASTVERFRQAQEAHNQLLVIRQELEVATRIQSAIRPAEFPRRAEFSLHAEIHTAREVGGDFFDYFDLPDGRFGIVVADVSGKGFGAALFMAVARTVIRTTALILPAPRDCLARTNDFLSLDNQAAMFVTVFYGVLDPTTGVLSYANAGHNPPYRVSPDGHCETLPHTGGIALGVMPDFEFQQHALTLRPGERLVLYTDGVTEAINPDNEEFGVRRLEILLHRVHQLPPAALIQRVLADVVVFADSAPQADDITLLALAYRPEQSPQPAATDMDSVQAGSVQSGATAPLPTTVEQQRRERY